LVILLSAFTSAIQYHNELEDINGFLATCFNTTKASVAFTSSLILASQYFSNGYDVHLYGRLDILLPKYANIIRESLYVTFQS
jgi:hypothetical protein